MEPDRIPDNARPALPPLEVPVHERGEHTVLNVIPDRPNQMDATWLQEVLSDPFPDVRVESVHISGSAQGTNRNTRLEVRYHRRAGAPERIFAKLHPDGEPQRSLVISSGMGRREVLFYRELSANLPVRIPKVYAAQIDESSGHFVILIEDLEASNCQFPDPERGVGPDLAKQAMDDLAHLHEHFARLESSDSPFAFIEPALRQPEFATGMLEHARTHRAAKMNPPFARIADLYIQSPQAVHDLWETGDQVVTHGDTHLTNLFIDGDRLGYLDWGCFARAPAMRDVGYFLCMALSVEDRRKHESELIRRYLSKRRDLGGTPPDFETAWREHQMQASYTVIAAAPTLLHPESRRTPDAEYAQHFLARALAAVQDHSSDRIVEAAVRERA